MSANGMLELSSRHQELSGKPISFPFSSLQIAILWVYVSSGAHHGLGVILLNHSEVQKQMSKFMGDGKPVTRRRSQFRYVNCEIANASRNN